MIIATWNVNSLKARLGHVLDWLAEATPDIVLLQELKLETDKFPAAEIEAAGYHFAAHGQKTYNGVAILAKAPITDVTRGLPGFEDEQARWIEGTVAIGDQGVRVASVYVPNGQSVTSEKFPYKLAFLDAFVSHARSMLGDASRPAVIGGDFNIAPEAGDLYDPKGWAGDVLFHPEERRRFRAVLHQGWTDAFRALHAEAGRYSWWDYRAGMWQKDHGLRIDHLLLSPEACDRLEAADIDRTPRGRDKASDHTPVWARLSDQARINAPYGAPEGEAAA
ncbi:exodeoxyribonuclease III [Tistrella mobilis]|uniref:exodeoxyribonuclease III n=1 Tax=Tistrella mobilis TaxID=171437 RepID=UPI003556A843